MRTHPAEINFPGSALIRVLSDFNLLKQDAGAPEFAEKLAQWVNFRDAIELSALHSAASSRPQGPALHSEGAGGHRTGLALADEAFQQMLAPLQDKITQSCSLRPGRVRNPFPTPSPAATLDDGGAFPPYRLYHQDQQREIETGARKLRAYVRTQASRGTPALQTLAALDARFENILSERETRLLSRLPLLLESRFVQLRTAHRQALADSGASDSPAAWLQPDGWLAQFCQDLQTVLLAELALRTEPARGLFEALQRQPHHLQHSPLTPQL